MVFYARRCQEGSRVQQYLSGRKAPSSRVGRHIFQGRCSGRHSGMATGTEL